MASTSITAAGHSPAEVIEHARQARRASVAAGAAELSWALEWARLHPCPAEETPAHWGEVDLHGEGLYPLAGQGAPWVAEFAPADLGAALEISLDAARTLIADALELAHRLPRLWDLVLDLRVPAWRARAIAHETRGLCPEAALFADRLIAATPEKIGSVDAVRLVQEARLWFDPDRAIADEEAALATRGVWSRPGPRPATTEMWMTLDTPDAELFDRSVSRVAGDLKDLGDTDTLDVRRARAVGILADPQYALDLMSGREGAAPTPGHGGVANLFVHLAPADLEADLAGGTGAVTIERLGAATTKLLTDWLTRLTGTGTGTGTKVILRPVLDLAANPAVDQHDPPSTTARTSPVAGCALRLPRLPARLPDLRPRPHHPLRPARRRRTPRADPPLESRAPVPHPPPRQDPHRVELPTHRRRRLHLDRAHRTPVRRRRLSAPPHPASAKSLTAPHPGTAGVSGTPGHRADRQPPRRRRNARRVGPSSRSRRSAPTSARSPGVGWTTLSKRRVPGLLTCTFRGAIHDAFRCLGTPQRATRRAGSPAAVLIASAGC